MLRAMRQEIEKNFDCLTPQSRKRERRDKRRMRAPSPGLASGVSGLSANQQRSGSGDFDPSPAPY